MRRVIAIVLVLVILIVIVLEVRFWFVERFAGKLSGIALLIFNPQLLSLDLIPIVLLKNGCDDIRIFHLKEGKGVPFVCIFLDLQIQDVSVFAEECPQLGFHFGHRDERVHVGDEELGDFLDLLCLVGGRFLVVFAGVAAHIECECEAVGGIRERAYKNEYKYMKSTIVNLMGRISNEYEEIWTVFDSIEGNEFPRFMNLQQNQY